MRTLFLILLTIPCLAQAQIQVANSNTRAFLQDIHFFDEHRGIAIGDSGTIIQSTNGGLDWSPVIAPTQEDLRKMIFFDDSTGLAIGKQLLRTTDGGNRWSILGTSLSRYLDIETLGDSTVYVSATDIGLIRSNDQGQTWDTLVPDNPNEELGLLAFIDEQTAYATSYGIAPNGSMLKTIDGGYTWQRFSMNSGDDNTVLEVLEFFSVDTGYMAGWYNAYLAKTTNGGSDWTMGTNDDLQNGGQMTDVSFPSKKVHYACGWHNLILRSTDGGIRWYWIKPDLQPVQSFRGLFFLNDTLGWVVGSNGTILRLNTANTTVGIEPEQSLSTGTHIFPNPASGRWNLTLPEGEVLRRVSVFDVQGKRIMQGTKPEDIPALKPGRYVIQIETLTGTASKVLVVE